MEPCKTCKAWKQKAETFNGTCHRFAACISNAEEAVCPDDWGCLDHIPIVDEQKQNVLDRIEAKVTKWLQEYAPSLANWTRPTLPLWKS